MYERMLIRRKVLTKRLLIVLFALIGIYCLLLFGNLTTGKSPTAFNYDVQFSKYKIHLKTIILDIELIEVINEVLIFAAYLKIMLPNSYRA